MIPEPVIGLWLPGGTRICFIIDKTSRLRAEQNAFALLLFLAI
jgi:hypothetical protein